MEKKQISGGILLSVISQAVSVIIGLTYTPYMVRVLGQSEYGLYQLVLSVVNYLNLMNFGFNAAYIKYYYIAKKSNDPKKLAQTNGMFLNIFIGISLLSIIAGLLLYFNIDILGNKLTESDYVLAKKLLIILVINLALSFPNNLFSGFVVANENFIFKNSLALILNILVPFFSVPLLIMGKGSLGVTIATLLITVIRLGANLFYSYKKLHIQIDMRFFDKKVFLRLFKYTFFIFLSDVVDQLNSNIDKFLLGRIMGTIYVAIYSVGFDLKNYFSIVSWIVPEMYIPEVNRLATVEEDSKTLSDLFIETGRINNYLMLLIFTTYALVGKQFIGLWVGKEYYVSYYAGLILMASAYIPTVQTLGVNIQTAKNMHKMRSIVYFFTACANVVLSIFLIRQWNVIGTCIGTALATLAGPVVFMNYYYHKRIGLDIQRFWKEIIKWFPFASVLFVSFWMITQRIVIDTWVKIFVLVIIYSLIYLMFIFIFEIKNKEKENLKHFFNSIKERFKR